MNIVGAQYDDVIILIGGDSPIRLLWHPALHSIVGDRTRLCWWWHHLFASDVSAPLSLPARSMKESLPCSCGGTVPLLSDLRDRRENCIMEWLREESALAPVEPVLLAELLCLMKSSTAFTCKSANAKLDYRSAIADDECTFETPCNVSIKCTKLLHITLRIHPFCKM